jgi:glyoxylase-like metal-dependent hydrolase (beta-lactamase superfamily II)
MSETRVHTIRTGRLLGNRTFMRGDGWSSLLRRPSPFEFPAHSFVLERPNGLIAIDTGLSPRVRSPRPRLQRRFVPDPRFEVEIDEAMRAQGLDPGDVRQVVLTHLDWDHAGGLAHFPNAEVLVHRPEHEFAATFQGRMRYEPKLWPPAFSPTLYDLDPEPFGPFPSSKAVGDDGNIRLVPIPGHSIGQVGVIVPTERAQIFLCADHVLRQDWFLEDFGAGRLLGLGIFFPKQARETSERVHELVKDTPTVLVPSHDAEAPDRVATGTTVKF